MRVAVITPFYKPQPDWLEQCHASVRAQSFPCTHFLASDGSGDNPLSDFTGEFLRLDSNHHDNGNTPRAAASMMAIGQGYDALAYLDADNVYREDHIESMVARQAATGAAVCTSGRVLMTLDGALLGPCVEVDGENFADTSCLFLTRAAYGLIPQWVLMPRGYSPICDFWMWSAIRQTGLTRVHTGLPSMAFRSSYPHHYQHLGKPEPPGCKSADYSMDCARKILSLPLWFGDAAATLKHWQVTETAAVKPAR